MVKKELIEIACQVKGETQNAYRIYDGKKTEWVPKSQVEVEIVGNASAICTMPEWLAMEKGFI
jgi:RNase P/RNase MRP subunit p29